MLSFVKKYYKQIISLYIIIYSIIKMIKFKRLEEASHLKIHDDYFNFFLGIFVLTLSYIVLSWLFNLWKQYKQLKNDKASAELALLKVK